MPNSPSSIPRSNTSRGISEASGTDAGPVGSADGSAKLRLAGLAVGLTCLAILIVAWHLSPGGLPFGERTRLSLPGCSFRDRTGYPCPTCGMTRAWSQAVRGNLVQAFRANIAGTILVLAAPIIALASIGTALAGANFYNRFVRPAAALVEHGRWAYALVGLLGLGWAWNALWAFAEQCKSAP